MRKYCLFIILLMVSLIMVGCSSNEDTIRKAIEESDYDVLVPSYTPSELDLEEVIFEGDLLLLTYTNADNMAYIEFEQSKYARALNIERLLAFTEGGEDPYEEAIPHWSYLMMGDFVGEYKVDVNLDHLRYEFIPAIPQSEIDWYPLYSIRSAGVEEEEFQKVILSLE